MSSGRRIFRLLKFINDLKQFYALIFKAPKPTRIIKGLMCINGFFYHILDNLNWGVNMRMIDEYFAGNLRIKMIKNFFYLIRKLLEILISLIKLKELYSVLREQEAEIDINQSSPNILIKLSQNMDFRVKIRTKVLELIQAVCKSLMISYNLRLEPFFSYSHPIIIGICGIVYASISLIRHFFQVSNVSTTISNNKIFQRRTSVRKKTIELMVIDVNVNNKITEILNKNYFDLYYIDFNKDFATDYRNVIKYRKE